MTLPRELDATRIRTWLQCQRKWHYKHSIGIHAAGDNPGSDLVFGLAVHEALEDWDRQLALGSLPESEVLKSVLARAWAETETWDSIPDLDCGPKSRETLIRLLIWYAEAFEGRGDPLRTAVLRDAGKPPEALLEVPFKVSLRSLRKTLGLPPANTIIPDSELYLVGRFDKMSHGLCDGDGWVVERKTTSRSMGQFYISRYQPEVQTSLYPIVATHLFPTLDIQGVMLESLQVGVNFCRMQRTPLLRHRDLMAETLQTIAWVFDSMESHGAWNEEGSLEDSYLLNESACMAGGRPCEFRKLCLSRPGSRPYTIESDFVEKTLWNPIGDSGRINTLTGPVESVS